LWVARTADEHPVGFAHLELLEPSSVHLKEIDVRPQHGRRGIGTRLISTLCLWALKNGFEAVTLTTFRYVPWNMPFYARLGFRALSDNELSPALMKILEGEADRGLDRSRRVAMRRLLV
jgi:GNAT superfamily N-acetyltransferase